jgi:protease I
MSIKDKRVALLVDNYFEQAEFKEPRDRLKKAGTDVTVVGTERKELRGLQHVAMGDAFDADALLDMVNFNDYDALVLPGGVVNADKLRMNAKAREWVNRFTDDGKLIAAICHAPWLLVSADVVEGRRLTSYFTLQDDIRNAGAEWIDHEVVLDGNLITSRNPDDIPVFVEAIEKWFDTVQSEK